MQVMAAARRVARVLVSAVKGVFLGFGVTFVFLAVLLAAAAVYVHQRFGPEEARSLAVEQLRALLHRDVSIDRLVLAPRGLKVRGLRVSGGPGREDLLVCDTALLTIKLESLLHRRLEFDTLRLESPRISLTREADGTWDLADLFAATPTARRGALPLALAAVETVVADGVLRVDDRRLARKIELGKLSLRADGFDLEKPFPLSLSFVSSISVGSRTVAAGLSAEGTLSLAAMNWSSATARVSRFSAQAEGVAVKGTGFVNGFARPSLDFSVSLPPLGPERWASWTSRGGRLSLPATRWRIRASLPAPGLLKIARLTADTPAGAVVASGSFDAGTSSSTLRLALSTREASLEKSADWHPSWKARSPRGKASLRVVVEGPPRALQVKEAELSLRGFSAAWAGRGIEGVDLDASASDEFASVKASVGAGTVRAYGNVFEDVGASLSVVKQTLTLERFAVRWGGSRLRLRGRVDRLSAPKEVLIAGDLDKLVWEDAQRLIAGLSAALSTRAAAAAPEGRPWLRTFKYVIPRGFPDTVGHLRVGEVKQENFWCRDLDLLWSLRGVTPALDRLGGEARVRFGPGRVADIPAVQDSNKFLRVIFLPFVYMHKMNKFSVFSAATAYPKTLDFSRIESEYALSKGVATTRYFHVDSGQLAAFAEGVADFGHESVDMSVLTRLTRYDGVLPEWWVDEAGRPAIGFRVKGDLNRPELEPRFKKIPVDEIERKLEEGRAGGKRRFEAIAKLRTL